MSGFFLNTLEIPDLCSKDSVVDAARTVYLLQQVALLYISRAQKFGLFKQISGSNSPLK